MDTNTLLDNIGDPLWRIRNLYQIKLVDGSVVDFKPKPFQIELARRILVDGQTRILIPKSRRQGASTVIGVIMADVAAFNSGVELALVDKTQEDAAEKVNTIVWTALDSLVRKTTLSTGNEVTPMFWVPSVNKRKIGKAAIRRYISGTAMAPESHVTGGKQHRGGTLAFAHISEIGTITTSEPKRANEILDGTIPAAEGGIVIIETTVKGGKSGRFYDMTQQAKANPAPSNGDWQLLFLPWWQDPKCVASVPSGWKPQDATIQYFRKLAASGIRIVDPERILWWERMRSSLRESMFQEFPSTLEEAFETPIAGAILAEALTELELAGRRMEVTLDPSTPLFCAWDMGLPQNTVGTVFSSDANGEVVLGVIHGKPGMLPDHMVAELYSRFPNVQRNFLPHDCAAQRMAGMPSVAALWANSGLEGIMLLPKPNDKKVGISYLCSLLSTSTVVTSDDNELRGAWGMWNKYRSRMDTNAAGAATETIIHDDASHWADSLRYMAEAKLCDFLTPEMYNNDEKHDVTFQSPRLAKAAERASAHRMLLQRGSRFR